MTRLSKVQEKTVNVVQDSADINKVAAEFAQGNADLKEVNKFTTSLTLSASD